VSTYILTWDAGEAGYPAAEYAADVAATAASHEVPGRWSVGSRRSGTAAGDRVFLLRQKVDRGIVASGRLKEGSIYAAAPWDDPARTAYYADVIWERVVAVEDRLAFDELAVVAPGHDWDHVLGSGQELQAPDDVALETRWQEVLDALDGPARPRRLPNWTWDETVLAYDLYLREYADPLRYPDGSHALVQALSALLRGLPLHPMWARADPRFRNPDGVARKIQNLMWRATGEQYGSPNTSATDVRVVAEMQDAQEVQRIAAAIRDASADLADAVMDPDEAEAPESVEGAVLEYRHKRRERDRKLVQRKKDELLKAGKPLLCEACGVDVAGEYDLVTGAVIECHHRLPLANGVRVTKLSDLALVCPTCHRALHSRSRWQSVDDLRKHLQQG
jgi:hypothetical protein